jgi:hypothetical protein
VHYPSAEEEELVQIKAQLIRSYVKEKDEELDGLLLENIFEYPAETLKHLNQLEIERKSQVIMHLANDKQSDGQRYTPSSSQNILSRRRQASSLNFGERTRSLWPQLGRLRGTHGDATPSPDNFNTESKKQRPIKMNQPLKGLPDQSQSKTCDGTPKDKANTGLDKIEEEKEFISQNESRDGSQTSPGEPRRKRMVTSAFGQQLAGGGYGAARAEERSSGSKSMSSSDESLHAGRDNRAPALAGPLSFTQDFKTGS